MRRALTLALIASASLLAHPMGNFSVNHYARLDFRAAGAHLTYVLDLAELPTFELMQQWGVEWKPGDSPAALEGKVREQARQWLGNLSLAQAGYSTPLQLRSIRAIPAEGAASMAVLRVEIVADAPLESGAVHYEDRNYEGRAGWKEIVVTHDAHASLTRSSQSRKDLSAALTHYPADPTVNPPQDLAADVIWSAEIVQPATTTSTAGVATGAAITSPAAPAAITPPAVEPGAASFANQQPQSAGTVVAGDYLSRLLKRRQIGWDLILAGLLAAFGLGAMHAMSPGHGKTIVAAYLVGSRGTLKHAGLLGFVVTFTHTFTVFLLGLGVLFFQQYVVPEKILPALGAASGLSIVAVGATLLYRRATALLGHGYSHGHHHDHDHGHEHGHHHHSFPQTHTHDGHTHSHDMPENVTLGSLIALGVSGGLVPCPSALILMLSAIALGRPGLGLLLLIGFSTGLAAVLMGIGAIAVYAKHLLPSSEATMKKPLFRLIPVFSAVVVIVLGLAMTAVSAGLIRPVSFLS